MSVRSRASAEQAWEWRKYPETVGFPHLTHTSTLLGGLRSIGRCRSMKRHLSQAWHATTRRVLSSYANTAELIGVRALSTWAKQTIRSDSAHLVWFGSVAQCVATNRQVAVDTRKSRHLPAPYLGFISEPPRIYFRPELVCIDPQAQASSPADPSSPAIPLERKSEKRTSRPLHDHDCALALLRLDHRTVAPRCEPGSLLEPQPERPTLQRPYPQSRKNRSSPRHYWRALTLPNLY